MVFNSSEAEKEKIIKERQNKLIGELMQEVLIDKEHLIRGVITNILYPFIYPKHYETWEYLSNKRLCTRTYFDKYFIYTSPDDIIGDVEADSLIEELPLIDEGALLDKFEYYYGKFGYSELTRVIHQVLSNKESFGISNDCVGKICVVLSCLSVNKERKQYTEREGDQFEITIGHLIETYIYNVEDQGYGLRLIADDEEQHKVVERILMEKEVELFHLFFATHVVNHLALYQYRVADKEDLIVDLLHRFIDQRGIDPIFSLSPIPITTLFKIWNKKEPEKYKEKVDAYLSEGSTDLVPLVRKFMYDTRDEKFDDFWVLFDEEIIYNRVKDIAPDKVEDYHTSVGTFIKHYEGRHEKEASE